MLELNDTQISASADDELSGHELDQAINMLASSDDAQKQMNRYHLIGHAIRDEIPDVIAHDLRARVASAVAAEPAILAPRNIEKSQHRFANPFAGLAVAASVAAIAVFGLRSLPVDDTHPVDTPPVAQIQQPPSDFSLVNQATSAPLPNHYILNHFEHAPVSNMNGMLPYVIIVTQPNQNR
jgi:sigma-E factor negative regulatory protein RseA